MLRRDYFHYKLLVICVSRLDTLSLHLIYYRDLNALLNNFTRPINRASPRH